MQSIGLWRCYIIRTITILGFIDCPFLYFKLYISETGFCLRLQVGCTQLGSVDRASLCRKTATNILNKTRILNAGIFILIYHFASRHCLSKRSFWKLTYFSCGTWLLCVICRCVNRGRMYEAHESSLLAWCSTVTGPDCFQRNGDDVFRLPIPETAKLYPNIQAAMRFYNRPTQIQINESQKNLKRNK
jgi:hypothetical protein